MKAEADAGHFMLSGKDFAALVADVASPEASDVVKAAAKKFNTPDETPHFKRGDRKKK